MSSTTVPQRLLTDAQVASRLGVSKVTAKRLRLRGELAYVYVGRAARVSEEALAEYLARQARPASR